MQFLISVVDDGTGRATATEDAAIDRFNTKLQDAGQWLFAGGLGEAAGVIDNRGDSPVVTDGPFVESKEYLAGFWIITADSVEEAMALGTEASAACHRKIEVRPFL